MSTIVEQFESVLLARAAQLCGSVPYDYTSGYMLTLLKSIVNDYPGIEDVLRKHIARLELTIAENSTSDDNDDEIVYFY